MKYDITALGEILIDFTPFGKDDDGDLLFSRKAGGAPLNLLATVSKYGGKTAFIGKVGNDLFGAFLRKTVKQAGISDEALITDAIHNTTLAFVELNDNGDRDFSFFRNYGADIFLSQNDVKEEIIRNSSIFHFGSLSLTNDSSRTATEYALDIAIKAGCVITYDPNYRPPLWCDESYAIDMMKKHLDKVDILKISKEEMNLLFNSDFNLAIQEIQNYGVKIILVTDGKNGASVHYGENAMFVPAIEANTVDTTGAGDIFFGTFLSEWIKNKKNFENININELHEYLKRAIKISGLSTEKHGAIKSIPERKE